MRCHGFAVITINPCDSDSGIFHPLGSSTQAVRTLRTILKKLAMKAMAYENANANENASGRENGDESYLALDTGRCTLQNVGVVPRADRDGGRCRCTRGRTGEEREAAFDVSGCAFGAGYGFDFG